MTRALQVHVSREVSTMGTTDGSDRLCPQGEMTGLRQRMRDTRGGDT